MGGDANLGHGELLSGTEISWELRCSATTVRLLMDKGKLPYIRTGIGRLARREDVERLKAEREAAKAQNGRQRA